MHQLFLLPTLLLPIAGSLAACGSWTPLPPALPAYEFAVDTKEYRQSLQLSTSTGEMNLAQMSVLDNYLDRLPRSSDTTFRIVGPVILNKEAGEVEETLTQNTINIIEYIRRRTGINPIYSYQAQSPPHQNVRTTKRKGNSEAVYRSASQILVRAIVSRSTLPSCAAWDRAVAYDTRNLPMPSLGCATENNLRLMIANSTDLLYGQRLAPADGVREAEGIVRYRTGKSKTLIDEKVAKQ